MLVTVQDLQLLCTDQQSSAKQHTRAHLHAHTHGHTHTHTHTHIDSQAHVEDMLREESWKLLTVKKKTHTHSN